VLPARDGSKTALAGSTSGFGRRKLGDLASQQPWCQHMRVDATRRF
jgi:hypothetical protein